MSAGSKPADYAHPRSIALLAREGIATCDEVGPPGAVLP